MDTRLRVMLKEFIQAKAPLTSTFIANINQVTSRTTRDDIKKLNQHIQLHGAVIQSIKGKGYQLSIQNEDTFHRFLTMEWNEDMDSRKTPNTPEQRVKYIVRRLLFTMDYIKLEQLADEMYISKSTIQNDMKLVRQQLNPFELDIHVKPSHGIKIIGEEIKIRFCMAEFFVDRENHSHADVKTHCEFVTLPDQQMSMIKNIIIQQLDSHQMTLSDIAIHNLFIHIAIAVLRIRDGHPIDFNAAHREEMQDMKDTKAYFVAEKIVEDTEKQLHLSFPKTETTYVALHLLGTKMVGSTNIDSTDIESILDPSIYKLIMLSLEKIEEEMHLGISQDTELMISLGMHLKPAMNRYKYGMNIRNPMLTHIKKNYPLAFQAAVYAGVVIEEKTDITIDENEIGYLALHIGAAMERNKLRKGPKRCLVVCASGMGTAQLIYYKLKSKFEGQMEVVGTTEYYRLRDYPLDDIDLIISSIPIKEDLCIPVIEVNAIIEEEDLQHIQSFISGKKTNLLSQYLHESNIFLNLEASSKQDVLEHMTAHVIENEFVDTDLLDSIYEREKIAPTAFGNLVAIPHPLTPKSDQTFISIATLREPIIWSDKTVQFICLLSVKRNSQEDLQSLYETLGKIIDRPSIIQKLVKAKDKNAFIEIIEQV
ncbi:transcriptional antiterminator of lichenan operon [Oceanobacillus iheyensis HTE831]|uniref:Transcriptional antiterminator of lichenan operon n=1 Tax=Oceanobacillus iheyensis (strain DSM 14371 / CIP 107618 / JCM 11309 / KCTC 3954 / HTE831) TaxID=221109 RepID=Q8EMS7_OCEIH|nr:BglG family transcription antiterminator [Oceanobacillus iheyensis]BAC14720.1 transcriptional antiterminator of lichenan operon [Oceanobacillus iheyensis HTE831]